MKKGNKIELFILLINCNTNKEIEKIDMISLTIFMSFL